MDRIGKLDSMKEEMQARVVISDIMDNHNHYTLYVGLTQFLTPPNQLCIYTISQLCQFIFLIHVGQI